MTAIVRRRTGAQINNVLPSVRVRVGRTTLGVRNFPKAAVSCSESLRGRQGSCGQMESFDMATTSLSLLLLPVLLLDFTMATHHHTLLRRHLSGKGQKRVFLCQVRSMRDRKSPVRRSGLHLTKIDLRVCMQSAC